MVKLTKRTMNNVVIFSMLIMMMLFNLDTLLPTPKGPAEQPLLSPEGYVLKIEQGDQRLERAGQQWRQVTEGTPPDISPQQQLQAWQQAYLSPVDRMDDPTVSPYVSVVWLAGEAEGQVVAFYPGAGQTWVKTHGQWFTLNNARLHELLPWNPELLPHED